MLILFSTNNELKLFGKVSGIEKLIFMQYDGLIDLQEKGNPPWKGKRDSEDQKTRRPEVLRD